MRLALVSVITLLYPLLVYFGLGHVEPRVLALLLAALALLRAFASKQKLWLVAAAGALILAGISVVGNQVFPLKLYPALVNAVLLMVFATSLWSPPTVIERIARLQEPDLPAQGVAYTRTVTKVWCGFFVLNGCLALVTALVASDAIWALYNGLIAYVLMGCLFGGEWLVRARIKRQIAAQMLAAGDGV